MFADSKYTRWYYRLVTHSDETRKRIGDSGRKKKTEMRRIAEEEGAADPLLHTEETKAKLREAWADNPDRKEKLAQRNRQNTGRKASQETRERMSEAQLERNRLRRERGDPFFGPEHAQRVSETWTDERKEKQRSRLKGKPRSEETKAKIRESVRRRNSDPETKRKQQESAKRRWSNPEEREKMAETKRAEHAAKKKGDP